MAEPSISPPPATNAWWPGKPVKLEAPGYHLRSLVKSDAGERLCAWFADAEVVRQMNSPPQTATPQAMGAHIEAFDNRAAFLIGIFDKAADDLHVGYYSIYCDLTNGNAETIVMVGDRAYWGKRVVTATRPAVIDFLFNRVGIEKVWGRPLARDFAGIHNYLELGFRCEGILRNQLRTPDGRRADQYFFGLDRRDWRARRKNAAA